MINNALIRNAVRKRVISATGIDPMKQFVRENQEFDPQGLSLWIREYTLGGNETQVSRNRVAIPYFMMQYDFCAPNGAGTTTLDQKTLAVLNEFDLLDMEKCCLDIPNYDAMIIRIKQDFSFEKTYARNILLFTLSVYQHG